MRVALRAPRTASSLVLPRHRLLQPSLQSPLSLRHNARALSTKPEGAASDSKDNADGAASSKKEEEASSSSSAEEQPLPLHQRFMADMSSLFGSLKSKVSGGGGADATANDKGGPEEGPAAGQGAVVVREPTFWEKHFDQESPFFERVKGMFSGAGDGVGGVTDRVFGVTEQAEAMELLRETHPPWVQEDFLQHISDDLGPEVLGAYLTGDADVLKSATREQALAMLTASVNERKERKLNMDDRILYMSDPELESIRIIGGMPTIIVAFETHQIYCLRSKSNGAVVEGSEDDIRAFHYLWALQPNLESEAEHDWQVTELAIRGVLETY